MAEHARARDEGQTHAPPGVALLMSPEQAPLARAVAARIGAPGLIIGMADTSGRAGLGAAQRDALVDANFGAMPVESDLRRLLAATEVTAAVLLSGQGVEEAGILETALRRGVRIASIEPLPASVAESQRLMSGPLSERLRFVPRFDLAAGMVLASEARDSFGPVRSLHYAGRGRRTHGSLAARLVDAMHVVLSLLGEPEQVDASVISIRSEAGLHMAPPTALPGLAGDLHAHLRYAGARSATITLSDRAGVWFRGLTLLGEGGCLRISERSFEHVGPGGDLLDAGEADSDLEEDPGAGIIGEQVRDFLDPHVRPPPPVAWDVVLSMAHAALLSARTGQPESPETIRRMV